MLHSIAFLRVAQMAHGLQVALNMWTTTRQRHHMV
jgi:hypothetical protein